MDIERVTDEGQYAVEKERRAQEREFRVWLGENVMGWYLCCFGQIDFMPDEYYCERFTEPGQPYNRIHSVDSVTGDHWQPDLEMEDAWEIIERVKAWPDAKRITFAHEVTRAMAERMGATYPYITWYPSTGCLFDVQPIDICVAARKVVEEWRGAN